MVGTVHNHARLYFKSSVQKKSVWRSTILRKSMTFEAMLSLARQPELVTKSNSPEKKCKPFATFTALNKKTMTETLYSTCIKWPCCTFITPAGCYKQILLTRSIISEKTIDFPQGPI